MSKLIIFFLFLSCLMFSQNIEIKLEKTIFDEAYFIGIDKFDDVYLLKNNVLIKKNETQIWEFKDFNLGDVYRVDLSNPLQLLLFYKDLQTIIVLDNQLNEVRRIAIDAENSFFIKDIGLSIQNKIWLFDEKFQRFGFYDMQNHKWHFFSYLVKQSPIEIFTNYNQIIWKDEKNNVFEMNIFGQVDKIYTLENNQKIIGIDATFLLFEMNKKIYIRNRKGFETQEIKNVQEKYDKIVFKNEKMFIFTAQNISVFIIK